MPADRFRLTLAQLDPTVGALAENAAKVRAEQTPVAKPKAEAQP